MASSDVVVIGGGVVGAACARALAHRALKVTVFDGGGHQGIATEVAGGMLAPLAEMKRDDPLLSLSVRARDLYTNLVPALEEATGIEIGLWTEGILQLAFSDDDANRLKSAIAWQRQLGFNSDWLDVEELTERCPGINPEAVGAMHAPQDGVLRPTLLRQALLQDAKQHGATIHEGTKIEGVRIERNHVTGVHTNGEIVPAETVLLAAGCWTKLISGLPRPVAVEPIRGQMAVMAWPQDEPPAIVYAGAGYVMHRDGEAMAGSTMEHVGFDPNPTPNGLETIRNAMLRVYPALEGVTIKRHVAGLRPVSADGRPLIGPDPAVQGLWYATGHGRNGVLLAGLTGEILAQEVTHEATEDSSVNGPNCMDPGRFWRF